MKKKVIVIGGGIVGLSAAYFLHQEGHQVVLFDQGEMNSGASYVNAGYLTPSHIVPLASPGMVTKGLKWMFNSSSPFYIKPRFNLDLINWGFKFMRSCSTKHVQRSLKIIKEINVMSKDLYHDFDTMEQFDFHLEDSGVMMAFQTRKAEREEAKVMLEAQKLGLAVERIDRKQIAAMQPAQEMDVVGAYLYRCDAHSTPGIFMDQLKQYLLQAGIEIHSKTAVKRLIRKNATVSEMYTSKGKFTAEEVVLASGAWTQQLLKTIGINLPIQAGKGYRLNEEVSTGINLAAILMEAKVAVTPMQGFTRFSGTMEIAGIQHTIKQNRVKAIAAAAEKYYPGLKITTKSKEEAQCGLRPLSPDGLPFIGRHSLCKNLTIATGHSMMGWSLGPATGKLVAELVSGRKTSLALTPFAPERTYG